MTSTEKNICDSLEECLKESMKEAGYLNDSELREYIELNFKAENFTRYKHVGEMKEFLFKKLTRKA